MLRRLLALGVLVFSPFGVLGQIADYEDDTVAGIPVNYTEAKVGNYTLPDPLVLGNGQPVRDGATWRDQRRPEILRLVEENWFGRAPGAREDMSFEILDPGTPAFDGQAIRRQVTIYFSEDKSGPRMDLLIYLPADTEGPVPLLLNMSFSANNLTVRSDPGVKVGRRWDRETRTHVPAESGRSFGALRVEQFVSEGFGIATFNKDDLAPDFVGSEALGVKGLYLEPGQAEPAPEEWGAIAAWAWGASRALDYFAVDQDVDESRVAITGVSRLGKTAIWAGASDPRFAMVIASCSGSGGAALARRDYGETLAHMVAPTRFPYQFAGNYASYDGRVDEWPVDAHMLIALIAPRPVLLQTGNTDRWSDPYGEFVAAVAAGPVYDLLGKQGLGTEELPAPGEPILHDIGYLMHDGGHGTVPSDFDVYLEFMKMHLMD